MVSSLRQEAIDITLYRHSTSTNIVLTATPELPRCFHVFCSGLARREINAAEKRSLFLLLLILLAASSSTYVCYTSLELGIAVLHNLPIQQTESRDLI